jgi:hypothetical protein
MLYVLSFYPDDERFAQAVPDMEAVWEAVLDSFAFLSPKFREMYIDLCPANDPDTSPYYSLDDGYCLSYPTEWAVDKPIEHETVFVGPLPETGDRARVFIEVEGAAGRTASQVADALVTEVHSTLPGFPIARSEIVIGGESAVLLDGMPGQEISRQIVVVHGERLYSLTFVPADRQVGQAYTQMEAIYTALADSFVFLTTVDGLMDDQVMDVAAAPHGAVWFATHAGLSHFDPARFTWLRP